jgi:predicted nucleic acid-binding protein
MILVDTSVVIDYSRSGSPAMLAAFKSEDAAICGVTRAEVLHGARDARHAAKLIDALNDFRQEAIPDMLWNKVGVNLAGLRTRGLTVPFADAIIASLAIHLDVELWTKDKQFTLIQTILPALRLYSSSTP